jgi:hypothetical protein
MIGEKSPYHSLRGSECKRLVSTVMRGRRPSTAFDPNGLIRVAGHAPAFGREHQLNSEPPIGGIVLSRWRLCRR